MQESKQYAAQKWLDLLFDTGKWSENEKQAAHLPDFSALMGG